MSRGPANRVATILLAVLGVLAPILVALNSATLVYVVSIERRLTRLETLQGLPPGAERPRLEIPATAATWRT